MGIVLKVEETTLDRPVALKFRADHLLNDTETKERLLREAKAAALCHSNVCPVYEIAEIDGKTFLGHRLPQDRIARSPHCPRPAGDQGRSRHSPARLPKVWMPRTKRVSFIATSSQHDARPWRRTAGASRNSRPDSGSSSKQMYEGALHSDRPAVRAGCWRSPARWFGINSSRMRQSRAPWQRNKRWLGLVRTWADSWDRND